MPCLTVPPSFRGQKGTKLLDYLRHHVRVYLPGSQILVFSMLIGAMKIQEITYAV